MALFTDAEKKSIAEAVRQAELHTAGELAVVVTERSADYGLRRGLLALVCASALIYEAARALPSLSLPVILAAQLGVWLLGYFLSGQGFVLRLIVGGAERSAMVERRALSLLLELGITETRDRSGVLIFLSEAEHRVVILADKGINERVAPDEWQTDVDAMVTAIRAGEATQGVLRAVERIGSQLAAAFPPRADDTNELPNEVVEV